MQGDRPRCCRVGIDGEALSFPLHREWHRPGNSCRGLDSVWLFVADHQPFLQQNRIKRSPSSTRGPRIILLKLIKNDISYRNKILLRNSMWNSLVLKDHSK
jgi:hypothetical protein